MTKTGLSFAIDLTNSSASALKLAMMKKEVQDTKPLFNKAIIIIEQSEMKTFRMGGRPAWKPSARVEGMTRGKTLMKTSKLLGSVTASSSPNAVRKQSGNELTFGTNLIYAPSHQFGYKPRNIPERKFLVVYPEDIKKMEVVFASDIDNRMTVIANG